MTHRYPPHDDATVAGDTVHETRKVESGCDLFDNNVVNLLMASIMSVGGMLVAAWIWDVPFQSILN